MIEKIRRFQDSWFVKGILVLTALSFVSLFGITGYIDSAGKNKPVIEVGDETVLQDAIVNQYNQEIQFAQNMFGEGFKPNDAVKAIIMQGVVKKELNAAIMRKVAQDNNISISDDLVRKIIFSQAEFMDADGKFDRNKFRRLLSVSGWNEARYINSLKQDIIKQHLVQTPVENINVPKVMEDKIAQIQNNKRIFKYVEVMPSKQKIDRKISEEELEQYYQDFASQFMVPESRDVDFFVLSIDDVVKNAKISDAEVKAYYDENIREFVIPEQREVLQMVFDNQEVANLAFEDLKSGKDFYSVSQNIAKQDKASTELGLVSKDMLIADMSDAVFDLKNGEYAGPVKSELGWHIMKVVKIVPMKETKLASVKAKITNELKKAKAYDEANNLTKVIDDKIGAGESFENVAKEFGLKIYEVKGLEDNGKFAKAPTQFAKLVSSTDFVDAAYSYNKGEVTQVIEADEGFVLVKVEDVVDTHAKSISEVRGDIEKIWAENERAAIAQEVINDVMHDLEAGDSILDVANRFGLKASTSPAINRNGTFADLAPFQIQELFSEPLNTPKVYNLDGEYVIAIATQAVQSNKKMSAEELEQFKNQIKSDVTQNIADILVDAYGSDYKIKVNKKYMNEEDVQ